ncbi:alanine/glycine:cation symporter family protein [Lusitaniella coriacea]|uniref:alanine/glycine:cation symporter family protein n=1 Tax=Lusitaniella coriacea TaxID=1983105 RepID=UPI003CF5EA38
MSFFAISGTIENISNDWFAPIDTVFSHLVNVIEPIVLFEIGGIPLIVLWVLGGGIFLTLRVKFINIWGFKHALDVLRGKYDNHEEEGDVSHFQAMATALSATVGLGNIAGVAIAIELGGTGAVFWMTLAGVLGMSTKFVECTLGQKYRLTKPDGAIAGGPMYYLSQGLAARGLPKLGRGLAAMFAALCVGAALGGGNMFQANQSFAAVATVIPALENYSWLYGLLLTLMVALVIVGGISRIGTVASKLIPAMLAIYIACCLWIIATHAGDLPHAIAKIVTEAFVPQAVGGGFVGILVQGIRRSIFSNGAGSGSAAIAHSAAKTPEPIRQGILAILEPFIDTVLICNLTAIAIVITQVYGSSDPASINGIELTAAAFGSAVSWFPFVLTGVVFLFAFSTIVSWSYYGEQCWVYLFNPNSAIAFKILFLSCLFLGSVANVGAVLNFSDMMLLLMTIPNLIGCFLLSGEVSADLKDYFNTLQWEKTIALSPEKAPKTKARI